MVTTPDVFDFARDERARAHALHSDTSMEYDPAHDPTGHRYRVLSEEVGEVAKEFNEAANEGRPVDLWKLRTELIQVAAMAGAWADACTQPRATERTRFPDSFDGTREEWISDEDFPRPVHPIAVICLWMLLISFLAMFAATVSFFIGNESARNVVGGSAAICLCSAVVAWVYCD